MGIVAESPAQAGDVPGERVVSGLGLGSSKRIRDLAIRDPRAGSYGQDVQQGVLVRREPNLPRPLMDAPPQRVDFEIGNLKRSHPRIRRDRLRFYAISIVPVGPRVHDEIVIRAQLGTATCSSAVRKAVAPRRSEMAWASSISWRWSVRPRAASTRA